MSQKIEKKPDFSEITCKCGAKYQPACTCETPPAASKREFWVAEELNGKLHIFRENHKGGGLTKFIEWSAYNELKNKYDNLNEVFSHQCGELREVVKDFDISHLGRRLSWSIVYEYKKSQDKIQALEAEKRKGIWQGIDNTVIAYQKLEEDLAIANAKLEKARGALGTTWPESETYRIVNEFNRQTLKEIE
jgi:hypothetical protein